MTREVHGLFRSRGENKAHRVDAPGPRVCPEAGLRRRIAAEKPQDASRRALQYFHPDRERRPVDLAQRVEAAIDEGAFRQAEVGSPEDTGCDRVAAIIRL